MRTGHGGAGSAEECGGLCQTGSRGGGWGGEDEGRRGPIRGVRGVLVVVRSETTCPHSPLQEKKRASSLIRIGGCFNYFNLSGPSVSPSVNSSSFIDL